MRLYLLLLLCCFLPVLPSCSRKEAGEGSEKPAIAVIPKGMTHQFWKSVHAGAMKAAAELDVEIIWKGPFKEDDRESQIKVVEDLVTRGVAGIVLAPLDNAALRVPVLNAARSGIPVAIIDSHLQGEDYISYIATDNFAAGKKAARRLAELLAGKGKIVMLRCMEGSASTMEREEGFLEEMKAFPGIEIASSNQYGGATTESAYQASENLLAPFTDAGGVLTLNGIFCPNESTTFGMLRALQDGGHAGKVFYVGFDSSDKLIQALAQGEIHGLVIQDPFQMGYLGVQSIMQFLHGQEVVKKVDTGSVVATRENMENPDVARLLKPDLKQWLNE